MALRNTEFARRFADSIGLYRSTPALEDAGKAGDAARRRSGEYLVNHARNEFNIPGFTFGARYDSSPIVVTDPTPAVLGHLIGGALVGTFMGVLLSYGFVGPIASAIRARGEAEQRYFLCIKAGILAYMQGYAPSVAVEFARKSLNTDVRPTFYEVEDAVGLLPAAT